MALTCCRDSALQVVTLRSDAEGVSLLFYRPELLAKRLSSRTMQSFLAGCGYPQPLTLDTALAHLQTGLSGRRLSR
jgi:hypothetical protein